MQLLWRAVASFEGGFVRDHFTMIEHPSNVTLME
jgi:hypothetical protein